VISLVQKGKYYLEEDQRHSDRGSNPKKSSSKGSSPKESLRKGRIPKRKMALFH
jgi:hypothetical protein